MAPAASGSSALMLRSTRSFQPLGACAFSGTTTSKASTATKTFRFICCSSWEVSRPYTTPSRRRAKAGAMATAQSPHPFPLTASQRNRLAIQSATIMRNSTETSTARREFLKFLAASPYVAALGGVAAYLERNVLAQNTPGTSNVITDPAKAINVFDFEEAAHRKVMRGHWAYMASGVDDDGTL